MAAQIDFDTWFSGSKVVDPSGAPMAMFHGSRSPSFSEFDPCKIGLNGRVEGAGIYFSSDPLVAESFQYDGHILSAYLNIRNPIRFNDPPLPREKLVELLTSIAVLDGQDSGTDWRDSFLSNCVITYKAGMTLSKAVEASVPYFLEAPTLIHQLGGIIGGGVSADTVNRGVQQTLGFDGYYANGFGDKGDLGGHIWVAMFNEQIFSLGPFDRQAWPASMEAAEPALEAPRG